MNDLPRVATRQCGGRESNLRPVDCKSGTLTSTLVCMFFFYLWRATPACHSAISAVAFIEANRGSRIGCYIICLSAPIGRKRCFCLTSDVCLSDVCLSVCNVAYIGPNSRTEMPSKTKIFAEVAYVTRT